MSVSAPGAIPGFPHSAQCRWQLLDMAGWATFLSGTSLVSAPMMSATEGVERTMRSGTATALKGATVAVAVMLAGGLAIGVAAAAVGPTAAHPAAPAESTTPDMTAWIWPDCSPLPRLTTAPKTPTPVPVPTRPVEPTPTKSAEAVSGSC